MYTITITVTDRQEVEDILHTLREGEEEGNINFPFQCETHEMTEDQVRQWTDVTMNRINLRNANPLTQPCRTG